MANSFENHEWPKITVVTPSFNQGLYLEDCIESILGQGYPNLEYIIMDGGSQDHSAAIIRKYEKYLTYWQSQPDGGQYQAINEGFKRSTGSIMTWLNSDDKFHSGAFATVARLFAAREDVDWIMGRPNGFNEQGQQSWIFDYLPLWSRQKYLNREYKNPYIQQEGTFWRRTLWDRAGSMLDTQWDLAGDLELWARFFRFAPLHTVNALLAGYRSQPLQKAQLFLEDYHQEAERIIDRELDLIARGQYHESWPAPKPILTIPHEEAQDSDAPPVRKDAEHLLPVDIEVYLPSAPRAYRVSAIVSTYKSERFIRACLEDLISQTLGQDLEIIVIDSASPQGERAVVEEFRERFDNITYLRTRKREGVYAAWNRGVALAAGRYLTNANTDDRHREDALERMADVLESRPDIALVYADVLITEVENQRFSACTPSGRFEWLEWSRDALLYQGCFMGPQPMWRRSLHEEYGYFDDTFVVCGDYEFWLRISQTNQFLHIPEFMGLYLKSPSSVEHANRDRQREEDIRLLTMYREAEAASEIIRRHYSDDPQDLLRVHCRKGEELFQAGNWKAAKSVFRQLVERAPALLDPLNNLGVIAFQEGELELAVCYFEKALGVDPDHAESLLNLGQCLEALEKYSEALLYLEKAAAAWPGDPSVHGALGNCYRQLGDLGRAKKHLARALELDAEQAEVRLALRELG